MNPFEGMKKFWLTWTVKGQKKAIECWHYSIEDAEASILKKHKPKAIPYEERFSKSRNPS